MVTSTLLNHRGAREVTRAELVTVEPPPPTRTWYPIAHRAVLDAVWSTLEGAGLQIRQSRLSLSHDDARFFGTLDLSATINDDVALAVGIRNSTDQSFPIGFCCGQRVFVCDNLAFTSEIVVSKKHTRFGQERYLESLARAVQSLGQYRQSAALWIAQLQARELSDEAANSYLLQAYEREIIGIRLLPLVIDAWRHPPRDEYRPRTAYALFNCFTDVLGRERQSRYPAESALATMRLSKLLTTPIDVPFRPVEPDLTTAA